MANMALAELANQPDDPETDDRRHDPDDPHAVARAMGGLIHGLAHSVRKGRKQNALDHQSEAEGCDKVQHRSAY